MARSTQLRPPPPLRSLATGRSKPAWGWTLAAALGDRLFDHRTRHGRYLRYNVGPLQRFGQLAVIALGSTQAEADEALQHDLPVRLGIG